MWRTSQGDRVLMDREATAFLDAVGYLRDMLVSAVEMDEPYQTGVGLFDRLQPTQQLAALHCVATALIHEDVPAPTLHAALEAAVYAVYRQLFMLIEIEIDLERLDAESEFEDELADGESLCIRQTVLSALRSPSNSEQHPWSDFDEFEGVLPGVDCDDVEEWEAQIESLVDRVLWDRDFLLDDTLPDYSPSQTQATGALLGIDGDYFAIPAPDAGSEDFRRMDRELVALRSAWPNLDNPPF